MSDRELLLECFGVIYQIYRDQHAGRRHYRPVSLYPTLSKLQNRLEKYMAEGETPASIRRKVNSPWT